MTFYERRKTGRSLFFKIYITVVITAVLLLCAAIVVVHFLLRDFESVQPKYLAEEVFNEYFAPNTVSVAERIDLTGHPFEGEEQALAYAEKALSGDEITYSEVSIGLEAGRKYSVKSGDKKIFSFELDENEEKSKFGFITYRLGKIEPVFREKVTVRVPTGYHVYINGIRADGKYITESGVVDEELSEYLPDGVAAPTDDIYTVTDLLVAPEVLVTDPDGADVPAEFDADSRTYTAVRKYDEQLKAEFSDYVIQAAEAYAAYMQNDASFRNVATYMDPASELYAVTRATLTGFVIDHNGYSFEDESADEFVRYDDSTFSCRVKLKHILHKTGSADYVEYLDIVFFYHLDADGDYSMFDRYNKN